MKRILINILEVSIGILLILLIIVGIKYKANLIDFISQYTVATTSKEVIEVQEEATQEVESTNVEAPVSEVVKEETAQEEPAQNEPTTQVVEYDKPTLVFTGDILLTGYLLSQYDNSGINGIVSSDISNEMTQADLTMVNEEFPFSNRGVAMEDKQFTFRIEPERINVFHDLGIDIVTLANNHVLDYGQDALTDTFSTLSNANIQYVGAGNNYDEAKQLREFTINDKKIGILAASKVIPDPSWAAGNSSGVFSTYDPSGLIKEIKAADPICDVVVVYVHWGVEKNEYPEDYQRELAKAYIDAGADIVIGSHPHVLQGMEYYNGKPIIYSLGNFVFGKQIPKTILLKAEIDEENNIALSAMGCATDDKYILNKASNQQDIYNYLTGISTNVIIDEKGKISEKQ
jgi:poly-gamma-glutamate synthesis protein (capsule biosynthesis protein)